MAEVAIENQMRRMTNNINWRNTSHCFVFVICCTFLLTRAMDQPASNFGAMTPLVWCNSSIIVIFILPAFGDSFEAIKLPSYLPSRLTAKCKAPIGIRPSMQRGIGASLKLLIFELRTANGTTFETGLTISRSPPTRAICCAWRICGGITCSDTIQACLLASFKTRVHRFGAPPMAMAFAERAAGGRPRQLNSGLCGNLRRPHLPRPIPVMPASAAVTITWC